VTEGAWAVEPALNDYWPTIRLSPLTIDAFIDDPQIWRGGLGDKPTSGTASAWTRERSFEADVCRG